MASLALTALWLIFVAELGDKTLFIVLLLSARLPPLRVFLGAAAAFLVHGLIAVALGQVLAVLPRPIVAYGTAALFLFFGVTLLIRPGEEEKGEEKKPPRSPIVATFSLVFLAEWGDMTQILTAAMVADHTAALGRLRASLAVLSGSVLGLWLGTALAVFIGSRAGKWLPTKVVRRAAGACFLAVGLFTAWTQANRR